jgi:hypothetical protein
MPGLERPVPVCVQGDPGAAKKFQEAQRAYDTLRDSQKRQVCLAPWEAGLLPPLPLLLVRM